jgi:hypothetical protein
MLCILIKVYSVKVIGEDNYSDYDSF